ncbi:MAG TPA: polysaccharide biosynthesis/export family protein [Opitutaceae bacterium]|nr:polysaccharide biosynthesis/export family protein [Opitutaceae bacterium]
MPNLRRLLLALLSCTLAVGVAAQSAGEPVAADPAGAKTDPAYKFIVGDLVAISVFGESELSIAQKIDTQGRLRLALVGDIELAGRSVREAERLIEQLYVEQRILRKPMVNISVQAYAVRDIAILGAVRAPGKMAFPPEKSALDITDVVTRAGGFLPTAKSDSVKITRTDAQGRETTIELDVESMLTRRGVGTGTAKTYLIYPGDRIWVPERLF